MRGTPERRGQRGRREAQKKPASLAAHGLGCNLHGSFDDPGALLEARHHRRNRREEVCHEAVVGHLEDGSLGVLVDGDDGL